MTVEPLLCRRPATVADGAGPQTAGGNPARHDGYLLALLPAWRHGRRQFCLDRDDAQIVLIVGEDAADQPAAADRHQQGVDLGLR